MILTLSRITGYSNFCRPLHRVWRLPRPLRWHCSSGRYLRTFGRAQRHSILFDEAQTHAITDSRVPWHRAGFGHDENWAEGLSWPSVRRLYQRRFYNGVDSRSSTVVQPGKRDSDRFSLPSAANYRTRVCE